MLTNRILKLHFLTLCMLSCFPLLPLKVAGAIILIFSVLSVLLGFLEFEKLKKNLVKDLIIHTLPFLIILFYVIFIDRSDNGNYYMQRSLSLLVFPLGFFLIPIQYSHGQKNIFKGIFICATLCIVVYGLIGTTIDFNGHLGPEKYYKTTAELFNDSSFSFHLRTFFETNTNLHPTHASIFLAITFLILLQYFLHKFSKWSKKRIGLFLLLLLFTLCLQIILAARTPFIGTLLAAIILIFLQQKNKIQVVSIGAGFLLIIATLVFITPSFSGRLKEISIRNMTLPTADNFDSFNIRTGIYKCTYGLIKENWLFGVGPGNVQDHLNDCYGNFSKEVYEGKNYNTHNQFLDYWSGMGIIAPLALLFLLAYTSFTNYKNGNYFPVAFCILFFIVMLTENVLVRQNGVVAFSYFLSLLCISQKNKPELDFRTIKK